MARGKTNYKKRSIVSGLSTQDIVNMPASDFYKLSESDQRKVVGRLVSSGNKRLRSLESKGLTRSAAYRGAMQSGGKFSTKDKTVSELKEEFRRAKRFLTAKTSTVEGARSKRIRPETVKTPPTSGSRKPSASRTKKPVPEIKYQVKGKSVNDLINMDIDEFNRLNERELRKVVGRLVSAGNKRLREFEEKGQINSPAFINAMESGGFFSTKDKDMGQLRTEFKRAKIFFESKSSTADKWQRMKEETSQKLKAQGVNIPPDKLGDVFKVYERLKKLDSSVATRGLKYNVLNEISTMSDTLDTESKVLQMLDRLDEIYEEQARLENEFAGVSGFFE